MSTKSSANYLHTLEVTVVHSQTAKYLDNPLNRLLRQILLLHLHCTDLMCGRNSITDDALDAGSPKYTSDISWIYRTSYNCSKDKCLHLIITKCHSLSAIWQSASKQKLNMTQFCYCAMCFLCGQNCNKWPSTIQYKMCSLQLVSVFCVIINKYQVNSAWKLLSLFTKLMSSNSTYSIF